MTGEECFNSIKVRVKRQQRFVIRKIVWFQFHKGTSKTADLTGTEEHETGFNSIKVRVKQEVLNTAIQLDSLFQFHKGTSKTLISLARNSASSLVSIP